MKTEKVILNGSDIKQFSKEKCKKVYTYLKNNVPRGKGIGLTPKLVPVSELLDCKFNRLFHYKENVNNSFLSSKEAIKLGELAGVYQDDNGNQTSPTTFPYDTPYLSSCRGVYLLVTDKYLYNIQKSQLGNNRIRRYELDPYLKSLLMEEIPGISKKALVERNNNDIRNFVIEYYDFVKATK